MFATLAAAGTLAAVSMPTTDRKQQVTVQQCRHLQTQGIDKAYVRHGQHLKEHFPTDGSNCNTFRSFDIDTHSAVHIFSDILLINYKHLTDN